MHFFVVKCISMSPSAIFCRQMHLYYPYFLSGNSSIENISQLTYLSVCNLYSIAYKRIPCRKYFPFYHIYNILLLFIFPSFNLSFSKLKFIFLNCKYIFYPRYDKTTYTHCNKKLYIPCWVIQINI